MMVFRNALVKKIACLAIFGLVGLCLFHLKGFYYSKSFKPSEAVLKSINKARELDIRNTDNHLKSNFNVLVTKSQTVTQDNELPVPPPRQQFVARPGGTKPVSKDSIPVVGDGQKSNKSDTSFKQQKHMHVDIGDACTYGRNRAREREWLQRDKETSQQQSQKSAERAEYVKKMMHHAWTGYSNYSWGANNLAPLSKNPHPGPFPGLLKGGLTIVDSLDTLWLMGMFDEVDNGKQWLMNNLKSSLDKSVEISLFEFNIRYVGGLLSMYALTNECEYKELAKWSADRLLPAFNTTTGLPLRSVNIKHGSNTRYREYGTAVLSEIGTLHLEFVYLSHITGDIKYYKLVENIRQRLVKARVNGLYGNEINIGTSTFSSHSTVSLGGMGDSFYEYLLKSYLQTGSRDVAAKDLYFSSMQAIIDAGMLKKSFKGLTYFGKGSLGTKTITNDMEHLTCFVGGMIGLSAKHSNNSASTLQLAEELGNTCHESYIRAGAHLGPESFAFEVGNEAGGRGDTGYYLRPETVETWFFLQRLTHDNKYRDWAWDMVQALEQHCKVEAGYSGLMDVTLKRKSSKGDVLRDDNQRSYFLAETLKYLYLIYKDDNLLPLTEWVFNTEAHPLPVLHKDVK